MFFFVERGSNRNRSSICPILNSPSKFEIVRSEVKFGMFLAPEFFSGEGPFKIFDLIFKTQSSADHGGKFRADRSVELGDFVAN